MATEAARISELNDCEEQKGANYVLYWMHRAQRAKNNPALQHAVEIAERNGASVLAVIVITDPPADRYARHCHFMLEGLAETAETLAGNGVKLVAEVGDPQEVVTDLAENAVAVVCDAGYLRGERRGRCDVARKSACPVRAVETECVVPVTTVSDQREYAARTIRKKINQRRDEFLSPDADRWPGKSSLPLQVTGSLDLKTGTRAVTKMNADDSVKPVQRFHGGASAAGQALERFIKQHLRGYADARLDPVNPRASLLSPYLNYGQISPVEIALKIRSAKRASEADKEAFLEELIVRRELAFNYVHFEPEYDAFSALPDWTLKTLKEHRNDARPERYTRAEMENAQTDDRYWNAAMNEMLATGYMHNYMRMYWGKKILEWCNTPAYAFRTALYLNNKYFLDGRNENSYTNVAWIFGLHDRAWTEREVFGKVRYMNANGLCKKFDIDAYVEWAGALTTDSDA